MPSPSSRTRIDLSNQYKADKLQQKNYTPINPFLSNTHENFPPLDEELLYAEEIEDIEDDEEIFRETSNVSLNLSIDTLAKIKPVDISNISDFLKEKEQEAVFEVCFYRELNCVDSFK